MREIMTSAELQAHKLHEHGRLDGSDDGYDDMELSERRGWRTLSSWGRDGWDFGQWPYVIIQTCDTKDGRFGLQSICEGDHEVYEFSSAAERERALNYLFLWYLAGEDFAPIQWDQRGELDTGNVTVEPKWLGPFSWDRCNAERVQ